MDAGVGWRRHCWTVARAELLPHLPLEVIRLRVKRAAELGLDYRTYATVRETSGRDIVAFLFSSNALRLLRAGDRLPEDRAARLAAMRERRACAARPAAARPGPPRGGDRRPSTASASTRAVPAPRFAAPWREIRAGLLAALPPRLAPGGVVLVGDTWAEHEWCEAARLGGYLAAERFFPA